MEALHQHQLSKQLRIDTGKPPLEAPDPSPSQAGFYSPASSFGSPSAEGEGREDFSRGLGLRRPLERRLSNLAQASSATSEPLEADLASSGEPPPGGEPQEGAAGSTPDSASQGHRLSALVVV